MRISAEMFFTVFDDNKVAVASQAITGINNDSGSSRSYSCAGIGVNADTLQHSADIVLLGNPTSGRPFPLPRTARQSGRSGLPGDRRSWHRDRSRFRSDLNTTDCGALNLGVVNGGRCDNTGSYRVTGGNSSRSSAHIQGQALAGMQIIGRSKAIDRRQLLEVQLVPPGNGVQGFVP